MNVQRGDLVLVDFPFPAGGKSKVRPALVIQNDRDNARLPNTIVAQITGNVQRTHEPTQILIDVNTTDGKNTGLQFDSAVNCVNLVTLDLKLVLRKLGALSVTLQQQVDDALKSALQL